MKKFLTGALLLLCVALGAVAQDNIPEFTGDDADKAILIDVKHYPDIKDLLIMINQHSESTITYRLYYCLNAKKGWQEEDPRVMEFFADTTRFGRFKIPMVGSIGVPIKSFKRIALVPADGKERPYKMMAKNNDLYFFVLPDDVSYQTLGKGATEIDVTNVQKKIKDNIKVVSKSKTLEKTGFRIFADKGEGFEFVATAFLKEYNDSDIADWNIIASPSEYKKFAIVAANGKSYTYTTEAKSGDLYIYVND